MITLLENIRQKSYFKFNILFSFLHTLYKFVQDVVTYSIANEKTVLQLLLFAILAVHLVNLGA
jgi:hypothetical protein